MALVSQIIREKGHEIYSVAPGDVILDALKMMAEHNIGAVLVMEENRVVGIFSERDYARWGLLLKSPEHITVEEVMTPNVYYVEAERSAEECMAMMTEKHIRHLPVVENQKIIGVLSIGDVVKAMITDQHVVIQSLENYILGRDFAH